MGHLIFILLLFSHLLQLPNPSSSHPLCTNSRAPFTPKTPLVFCPYNGSVCCDSIEDLRLQRRFQDMNISDSACASLMKSILCATCDQFSAELFKIESRPRTVPVLCNSTVSVNSTQSAGTPHDFCAKVWDTCQNILLLNSPFAPSLQGRVGVPVNSTYSKLTDLWQSKDVFCEAFGGSSGNGAECFNGKPVSLSNTETQPPNGLCLEKISNGSYLDMVAHPDGSNRVFLASQQGKIWLATVPEDGSGGTLVLNESNPFLDLTDAVHFDSDLGLMGIAFHPNFAHNGRFFISFNCDKTQWPECSGRCSCNTDVGCDPSKLSSHNGAMPCQYSSVIAEFTANGTASHPSLATRANPLEVRRIFTMGLPYTGNHGGQILFGPADGYLYFMMGDGEEGGDPYNFAQTKKSLLGKIMRFDIDNIPTILGGSSGNGAECFNGKPVSLSNTETQPPNGLCLEKISNGSYLDMVAHPDGSNRVFLASQQGKIWLATVPEDGSGGTLVLNESNPFLDLTDAVHFDSDLGLMGIAFHPNFAHNGRFFISFNCDKTQWPECSGRCSCNTDVGCDPSKLSSHNGAMPCQYSSVIAEFTANGTASHPSLATRANPLEVRRIFTMGLPYTGNHGGQILFGPADGYLYFMMGDGEEGGDPYNFAQTKKSLLGKIMRFDIDNIPSAIEINDLSLWGNYSIPRDNPYSDDKEFLPEIWALGLRNPWRCSFDSERPSYFLCGDCGQNQYEEVDIIMKGGNYGWRVYEGNALFNPPQSPGGNTSASSISPIFPVMGYNHSTVNTNEGSASITGGYFYRSKTDPCMYGRYLYMDLYAFAAWVGTENPENSGNFTSTRLSFRCAYDSPIQCSSVAGSLQPSLGYVFSFGEDNSKDIYVLTSKGVHRVVRSSRCNYTCAKENGTASQNPSPGSSSSSQNPMRVLQKDILLLIPFFWLLLQCLTS